MIKTQQLVNEGYVEIGLVDMPAAAYGAALTWSVDDGPFRPCAVYPARADDALLATTFWTWNQAAEFGRVKFAGRPKPVWWNLYLNRLHEHRGGVRLRADVLLETGVRAYEARVELRPSRAVYLDDWDRCIAGQDGWQKTADGCVTVEMGRTVQPLRVPVGVAGRYEIRIGLRTGCLTALLKLSTESRRYPFWVNPKHPELEGKSSKEILWKTAELPAGAWIEISPIPASVRSPKVTPFGSVAYVKLVPVARQRPRASAAGGAAGRLALYFEPFSWAFYYNLTEPWQVREAMELYREIGATEIHNQIIRFGSKALHHSRVAERYDAGALRADDGTFSDAPTDMVKSLDVLRETIDACRELGLTHYANAALTNCYPGSGFEEKISREHPDWRTGNVLRFSHPEVRAHAAAVLAEFVQWGADGVSVDCLRYPDHHTEEELLAAFREMRRAIDAAADGRQVPLTVRLPASDPVYFRAFATLVREGAVQCVVPSTLWPREAYTTVKPYLRWKDYGCRVLGIIDGWKSWVGTFCDNYQLELLLDPRDIRADIRRHLREGADGIYVYQADSHLADPFTRGVWGRRKRGWNP